MKIPRDAAAERAVLSACLSSAAAAVHAADHLHEKDFYDERNRPIFTAIKDALQRGADPDLVLVGSYLENHNELEHAGGWAYLSSLGDELADTANITHYTQLVLDASSRRELGAVGRTLSGDSAHSEMTPRQIADNAQQQILSIMSHGETQGPRLLGDIAYEERARVVNLAHRKIQPTMISTGFEQLDVQIGGLDAEQLIVLAAMTGVGKTALALQIAGNVASRGGHVLYNSLEMSDEQLVRRMISRATGISSSRLKYGRLANDERSGGINDELTLNEAVERMKEFPLWFDGRASVSLEDIRASARKIQLSGRLDLIVVDYLQLVRPPKTENRVQEVSAISRGLKVLAKDLKVPLIALSQLNRTADFRLTNTEPEKFRHKLAELRESGSIEQDADVVLFIVRQTQPVQAWDDSNTRSAVLQVAKQREGPTGELQMYFSPEHTEFAEQRPGEPASEEEVPF